MLRKLTGQLFVFALFALLVGCASSKKQAKEGVKEETSVEDATKATEIVVATWNIQHLGSGRYQRTDNDFELLRAYAAELDADVIAVQEVTNPELLRRIYPPDANDIECEEGGGAMLVCVVIRKDAGLEYVRHEDVVALDVSGGLRSGVDVTLQKNGEELLRLMAVHLKSGCFKGPVYSVDASADCEDFSYQIEPLEKWIDARASEAAPFAVVGDFNRRFNLEDEEVWAEIDDAEPPNADLTNLTAGKHPKCWDSKYDQYIDHIVVGKRANRLVKKGSFREVTYGEHSDLDNPTKALSDHCPVAATFQFQ